jgi:hypothetical protein
MQCIKGTDLFSSFFQFWREIETMQCNLDLYMTIVCVVASFDDSLRMCSMYVGEHDWSQELPSQEYDRSR